MLVWSTVGLFQFCDFIELDLVSVHKNAEKKLADIQRSWSHTPGLATLSKDDGYANENGKNAIGLF